jgi:hypothetical protein
VSPKVLAALRRYEIALFWVAMVLGVYLAVATLLRAANHHSTAWEPWHPLFIAMLLAAIFVPVYGFLKTLDARELKEEAAERELKDELDLLCQQAVSVIADRCASTSVNDLAVQVWICLPDGHFDRLALFMLPEARPRSGVEWRKGKGIAGTAWSRGEEMSADLGRLKAQLEDLGDAEFDRLPDGRRYGMTAAEVRKTSHYAGIYAIPLFSEAATPSVLGVFVVDYVGGDGFACVEEGARERPVQLLAAVCEEVLTEGHAILGV